MSGSCLGVDWLTTTTTTNAVTGAQHNAHNDNAPDSVTSCCLQAALGHQRKTAPTMHTSPQDTYLPALPVVGMSHILAPAVHKHAPPQHRLVAQATPLAAGPPQAGQAVGRQEAQHTHLHLPRQRAQAVVVMLLLVVVRLVVSSGLLLVASDSTTSCAVAPLLCCHSCCCCLGAMILLLVFNRRLWAAGPHRRIKMRCVLWCCVHIVCAVWR